MPAITAQEVLNVTESELVFTTLDGSTDTLTFNNSRKQLLILTNTTGAPVAVTLLGDAAEASFVCNGFGENAVDPVSVTVGANATHTQYLNPVGNILKGETTISNGTGLTAALINV
jgi:hypothetical protein